jgi:Tfp pilus assembly protein FimT
MSVNTTARTKHVITWVILGAIFIILAAIALGVFRSAKASAQANTKADQLIGAIEAAGYPAPTKEQITRTLGEDGGSICADPNSSLRRAVLNAMLVNGAGGPGARPVIADSLAVKGQVLVMQVYCPEKVAAFQEYAGGLKFGDVVHR